MGKGWQPYLVVLPGSTCEVERGKLATRFRWREALSDKEKDIIRRWKKGDKRAFGEIVRLYMRDAFLIAIGFVRSEEDAKDLSQEAFIKAFEARDRFDPEKPFYPWFYRILKNHCINFLKRCVKRTESLYFKDYPGRERFSSSGPTPLESVEREERRKLLLAAIDRLSFDHREIIILKSFKCYSYAEIARVLDIPLGTVMSRLYYARKMLGEILVELEDKGIPADNPLWAEGSPSTGEVV